MSKLEDLAVPLYEEGQLLDLLPDGVVIADHQGIVTHANIEARRQLGAQARAGVELSEAVALQDLDGCSWWDANAPYAGLSIRREVSEAVWLTAQGAELLVHARLIRDRPGGPVRHVAITLRSARARARLDRERSDLVATVAHELRSPLTGVRGFTSTLLERWDKFDDEQKKLLLESVLADTERLTRLIGELLDVARIDTGRLSLYQSPCPPEDLILQVIRSVSIATRQRIGYIAAGELPRVMVDPDRFLQVITNLVDNAVRHGGGEIQVVALVDPSWLTVCVDDGGPGIGVELRRRVFTKFWKQGIAGGTGLGLYIAHGLTLSHGGEIEIDRSPNGGARVLTRWPLAANHEAFLD